MQIINLTSEIILIVSCYIALYLCRSYSKMLSRVRERCDEYYEIIEKYKELWEKEKEKEINIRISKSPDYMNDIKPIISPNLPLNKEDKIFYKCTEDCERGCSCSQNNEDLLGPEKN